MTGKVYVDQIVADDLTDYHKALRKRGMSDRRAAIEALEGPGQT